MGYVYRYTDKKDNKIKYVGIVWSRNRTLTQRVIEHMFYDYWCIGGDWKIEYVETPIDTRTDAEYMESHFVSLFHTGKQEGGFNDKKDGWGVSSFIPKEWSWKEYKDCVAPKLICDKSIKNFRKIKVDFIGNFHQTVLTRRLEKICVNICKCKSRSFIWDYFIPEKYRAVYYKDGESVELVHLNKIIKKNGEERYLYKCSEVEAQTMFEYLTECCGYEKSRERKTYIQTFEECYGYSLS